jgi:hypothetical protein
MKLEDQCCAVEQARELVRLGVNIETCFEWVRLESDCIDYQLDNWTEPVLMSREMREACEAHIVFHYPAPTVGELGVLLGKFTVMKYANDKCWRLYDDKGILRKCISQVNNEAQARADALIWLIRDNYITPGELKL